MENLGDGVARLSLEVTDQLRNPNGRLHGSILFAMLDFAMGAALFSLDPTMARTATVQMDLHFIRSAREGTVWCEARVIRRGRLISFTEGEVRDESGELVCRGTGTFTSPADPTQK